ncbi:MAG: phosphoheptose isomerase [Bacteroidia bacterium]|nr:phosphoheptose isomerase [Bacteroidia bacterium]
MHTPEQQARTELFDRIAAQLADQRLRVAARDESRPWGGFFVLEESDAPAFIRRYFDGVNPGDFPAGQKLSPKILIVAPHKRLSWQYHHRRAELWQVTEGPVGVARNSGDQETEPERLMPGALIRLAQGERHRLVGLEGWGVVAEIWQHTDPAAPSDENDIVRLQDDFGR